MVSLLRKLGLTAPESKALRDILQLTARKCSYVIWINRFNKNFNPTLRISSDGVSLTEGSSAVHVQSSLSKDVQDRVSRSRNSAFLRLRASRNRRTALVKLRESRKRRGQTLVYRARTVSSVNPPVFDPPASRAPATIMDAKTLSSVPPLTLPLATEAPPLSASQLASISVNRQAALSKLLKKGIQDHWVAIPKPVTSIALASSAVPLQLPTLLDQKD